jgi:hypothetical protein
MTIQSKVSILFPGKILLHDIKQPSHCGKEKNLYGPSKWQILNTGILPDSKLKCMVIEVHKSTVLSIMKKTRLRCLACILTKLRRGNRRKSRST